MSRKAQKTQPVKPAEQKVSAAPVPDEIRKTTPIEEAVEQDKQTATTMKIKLDTKTRLEELKEVFKAPDLDAVVGRLIETLPKRLSTEEQVHLVMPATKYRWLMAHQDTCDCRVCLNDAKV